MAMNGMKKTVIGLSAALALSLSANAFLGAELAARHMGPPPFMDRLMDHGPGAPPDGPPEGERPAGPAGEAGHEGPMRGGIRAFLRGLPDDVRAPIAQSMKDHRDEMMAQMQQVMQARKDVQAALQAEPYDAEKLRAALANQRALQSGMQAKVHEQMVDVVGTLSPEQRASLSENFRKLFR